MTGDKFIQYYIDLTYGEEADLEDDSDLLRQGNECTNALVEYVFSSIVNSYAQMYATKSQAGLDAMNNYIDSNYSSTTSESTNEKVMEMWDDYINEVDNYQTLDGGTIKTSMYNDTVQLHKMVIDIM